MRRFYAGLNAGATKSRSLRDAMIEVKKQSPHPFYWAPFVLMGKN
jgi:CHAT domain-containing protein